MRSRRLRSLFSSSTARASLLVVPALTAACGGSAPSSSPETRGATTAPPSPPVPSTVLPSESATTTPPSPPVPSVVLPSESAPTASWPACATEPDPALCVRAVDEAFAAGGAGMHAASDVVMDSECTVGGCRGTLVLIAPDGFSLTATLESGGPNEPWRIVALTRDPGGPLPVPSSP